MHQQVKIKNIKKIDVRDRYDITVARTGNFYANGVLIHNSSSRFGLSFESRKLTLIEKIAKKLGAKVQDREWRMLVGSRRVILEKSSGQGYYGSEEFRYIHPRKVENLLHKGETVYGELVGWVNETTPIMSPCSNSLLGKQFVQKYGEKTHWNYGTKPGETHFYVYRITKCDEDGNHYDLSWDCVKRRANQLGLETVVEHDQFFYDGDADSLLEKCKSLADGPDPIDPSHIKEGVVVRVDYRGKTSFYKYKSFEFKVLEGIIKDSDVIDIEESS